MTQRDPGTAPKTGDRVKYVIIQGERNSKMYEKAEDPMYVLENGIQLDIEYYIEHQFREPLTRIFEPIEGID